MSLLLYIRQDSYTAFFRLTEGEAVGRWQGVRIRRKEWKDAGEGLKKDCEKESGREEEKNCMRRRKKRRRRRRNT